MDWTPSSHLNEFDRFPHHVNFFSCLAESKGRWCLDVSSDPFKENPRPQVVRLQRLREEAKAKPLVYQSKGEESGRENGQRWKKCHQLGFWFSKRMLIIWPNAELWKVGYVCFVPFRTEENVEWNRMHLRMNLVHVLNELERIRMN